MSFLFPDRFRDRLIDATVLILAIVLWWLIIAGFRAITNPYANCPVTESEEEMGLQRATTPTPRV